MVESTEVSIFIGAVSGPVSNVQLEIAARKSDLLSSQQSVEDLIILSEDQRQPFWNDPGRKDPDAVVEAPKPGFGDQHAPELFRAQLKNRRQKPEENLQQMEADIERLSNLGDPTYSRDVLNTIITDGFITALGNSDTRKALSVVRIASPGEALTFSLNYEASEESSDKSHRVRKIEIDEEELDDRVQKIFDWKKDSKKPRCWNCDRLGHLQRDCRSKLFKPRKA